MQMNPAAQPPTQPRTPEKEKKTPVQTFLDALFVIAAVLVALAIAQSFFLQWIRVDGSSMEHTLHNGEVLLVTRPGEYQRGEVVICRYPRRTDFSLNLGAALSLTRYTIFVKRLVALPGDSVEIRQGQLYVNDAPVPNPAEMGSVPPDYERRVMGPNQYFVIGDNRRTSHDSRSADVGPISGDMLQGHVRRVVWPLGQGRKIE